MAGAYQFPFVGRVAEVARCVRMLGKAPSAEDSLNIIVTGERGVGKTRFMEEILPKASRMGFRVLYHRCQKWDKYAPFSTVAALLRVLFRRPPGWTPRTIEGLAGAISEALPAMRLKRQELEMLCWLFGSLAVSESVLGMDNKSRRAMIASLFDRMLAEQLRRQQYLLLAVDDIYHSDEFSSSYLLTAAYKAGVVLMVSTLSTDMLPIRVEGEVIALSTLAEGDIRTLLTGRFGTGFPVDRFAPKVMEVSGGNALHLAQLLLPVNPGKGAVSALASLLEEKAAQESLGAASRRLKTLDRFAGTLVKAASVVAERFPMPILKGIVGSKFPMTTALRNIRKYNFARVIKDGGRQFFQFQHGILREAVYDSLNEVEKQDLHAAAADSLRRYYGGKMDRYLRQVAHHYEEAGDRENASQTYREAGAYLFRSGENAAAEECFRAARRLATNDRQKFSAWTGIIWVLETRTDIEGCLEETRQFFEADPPPLFQATVYTHLSRLHTTTGSVDKAIEAARDAYRIAEEHDDKDTLARACSYLAFSLSQRQQLDEARKYGEYGMRVAREAGDDILIAALLHTLATIASNSKEHKKARRLYEESARLFEQVGQIQNVAVARLNLGSVCRSLGNFKKAYENDTYAIDFFDKAGAKSASCISRYNTASLLMDMGEYDEALRLVNEGAGIAEELKSEILMGGVMLTKGFCLLKMGEIDKGLELLDRGWEIRSKTGRTKERPAIAEAHVEAAILRSDLEAALQESLDYLSEAAKSEDPEHHRRALEIRLQALLAAGKLDEAAKVGEKLGGMLDELDSDSARAHYLSLLAQLAGYLANFKQAEGILGEAVSTGVLIREDLALTELAIGEALLAAGKRRKALDHLAIARDELSSLVRSGYRDFELQRAGQLIEGS